MGIVLAVFWEHLYNDEEWRQPQGLLDRLLAKSRAVFDKEISKQFIDWRISPPRNELWDLIEQGIRGYIATMRANKLLGSYARSEVEFLAHLDPTTPLGGKADLVFERDGLVYILDGKNSKRHRVSKTKTYATYTDPDQLRWYALCYYLKHKKLPDRLGFVFFRYPAGTLKLDYEGDSIAILDDYGFPTGEYEEETGVEWVPCTQDDLKGLARRAKDVMVKMTQRKFEPTPTPNTCKYCIYQTVCPERIAQKKTNSDKRKTGKGSTRKKVSFEPESVDLDENGTFGF
jgi:hypothetical protein